MSSSSSCCWKLLVLIGHVCCSMGQGHDKLCTWVVDEKSALTGSIFPNAFMVFFPHFLFIFYYFCGCWCCSVGCNDDVLPSLLLLIIHLVGENLLCPIYLNSPGALTFYIHVGVFYCFLVNGCILLLKLQSIC